MDLCFHIKFLITFHLHWIIIFFNNDNFPKAILLLKPKKNQEKRQTNKLNFIFFHLKISSSFTFHLVVSTAIWFFSEFWFFFPLFFHLIYWLKCFLMFLLFLSLWFFFRILNSEQQVYFFYLTFPMDSLEIPIPGKNPYG